MNGIKALMKETQRTSLAPSAMQGHTVGGGGGGRQPMKQEAGPHQILNLPVLSIGEPSFQNGERLIFVVYKPPSERYFCFSSLNQSSQL